MASRGAKEKPHVVCVPAPFASHVKAMLQFAKLLYHTGFHITFVSTSSNHERLLNARGPNSLDGLPDFQFHAIPDGLLVSNHDASPNLDALCISITENLLNPFLDLLSNINDTSTSNIYCPPVSCIFADGFMSFTITAAEKIGVPVVHFFTVNACALMVFKHFRLFREMDLFKDESYLSNEHSLNTILDWIPGTKDLRVRDLPFLGAWTRPKSIPFDVTMEGAEKASKAKAIVIHTFEALEHDTLEALSSMLPPLYSIGPIPLLMKRISPKEDPLNSIGYNLWKEETECLEWLDSKENDSVLYVNFGSITFLTSEQLIEFAWGLANSKHNFLWIIRPDLVMGDKAVLPKDFAKETKERCMISGWCPQEEVLIHPSVRGFLTHCGWNSIIESICSGVPLICWPFIGDQILNRRYSCDEWGIGLEMSNEVKRETITKLIVELMEGEKGKKLRENVIKWKKKAEDAIAPDGSTSVNFNKLINEVLLSKD